MDCHSLLQGIFLTQGLNPALQADSLSSEPPEKPNFKCRSFQLENFTKYSICSLTPVCKASHSVPGVGNGNPLHCSCLRNSMDRGAWRTTVHGVAKSRTRLNSYLVLQSPLTEKSLKNQCLATDRARTTVLIPLSHLRLARCPGQSSPHLSQQFEPANQSYFKPPSALGFLLLGFPSAASGNCCCLVHSWTLEHQKAPGSSCPDHPTQSWGCGQCQNAKVTLLCLCSPHFPHGSTLTHPAASLASPLEYPMSISNVRGSNQNPHLL